jgi:metal-sulfur cluster biosynthetic enzyme
VKLIWTKHFENMVKERNIPESIVNLTLTEPDSIEQRSDGTLHYIKKTSDNPECWLRIIINHRVEPARAVTVFFDRRLKEKSL